MSVNGNQSDSGTLEDDVMYENLPGYAAIDTSVVDVHLSGAGSDDGETYANFSPAVMRIKPHSDSGAVIQKHTDSDDVGYVNRAMVSYPTSEKQRNTLLPPDYRNPSYVNIPVISRVQSSASSSDREEYTSLDANNVTTADHNSLTDPNMYADLDTNMNNTTTTARTAATTATAITTTTIAPDEDTVDMNAIHVPSMHGDSIAEEPRLPFALTTRQGWCRRWAFRVIIIVVIVVVLAASGLGAGLYLSEKRERWLFYTLHTFIIIITVIDYMFVKVGAVFVAPRPQDRI